MQDRDHAIGFGRAQSSHDLIEQQKLRLGRKRAGDLEALAVRQRQSRSDPVPFVEEFESRQQQPRLRACVVDAAPMQQRADDDVVLDAECRKRPHDLKGAGDAAPADGISRQSLDLFPANLIEPASGAIAPAIMLNSVVLPAPFGPMTAKIAPCGTAKLT